MRDPIHRLTTDRPSPAPPPEASWEQARTVTDERRGYLQQLDAEALAAWAARRGTAIRRLVRPGTYVFPGAAIARLTVPAEGIEQAIRDATALGPAGSGRWTWSSPPATGGDGGASSVAQYQRPAHGH